MPSIMKVSVASFLTMVMFLFVYTKTMFPQGKTNIKKDSHKIENSKTNIKKFNHKTENSILLDLKHDDKVVSNNVRKVCPSGSREPSLQKDAINNLFHRLTTLEKFKEYTPVIQHNDPWVVTFDDFLTDEECDMVIEMSKGHFSASGLAGAIGTNLNYRRSESFSCDHNNGCLYRDAIKPIIKKMHELTNIDMRHSEDLTITHYNVGGFYGRHHDYILEQTNPRNWKNCGPRTFTFLVYLNDVEEGGETKFFHLDLKSKSISVKPKRGRAIFWPNTFNDAPFEKDERTAHEALKVLKGEKYILQTWFYMFDYAANMGNHCCN